MNQTLEFVDAKSSLFPAKTRPPFEALKIVHGYNEIAVIQNSTIKVEIKLLFIGSSSFQTLFMVIIL